jgi:hypothetical protein
MHGEGEGRRPRPLVWNAEENSSRDCEVEVVVQWKHNVLSPRPVFKELTVEAIPTSLTETCEVYIPLV